MKEILFSGILTGEEIVNRNPNKTGLDLNTSYKYNEGCKLFGGDSIENSGIIECEATRIKTDEENAIQLYEEEKANALADLKQLEDDITLGIATQEEYDDRKSEWLEYHNANNPY